MVDAEVNTAAARMLSIPELRAEVLEHVHYQYCWGRELDRSIFSCMLVDSQWSEESIRHVWKNCGGRASEGRVPRLNHLATMEIRSRRKYARYIRKLTIGTETRTPVFMLDQYWAGTFLPLIASLNFPHLDEIVIIGATTLPQMQQDLLTRHLPTLLRQTVKTLEIQEGLGSTAHLLSEQLYNIIGNQCKGLTELTLQCVTKIGDRDRLPAMAPALAGCVQKLTCLTCLTIGPDMARAMSLQALKAIALHPSLRIIEVPRIELQWIQDLAQETPLEECFPRLHHFDAELNDASLRLLIPHLTNLTYLALCAPDVTTTFIEVLGDFDLYNLRHLLVGTPDGPVLHGRDFERLSTRLPNLETLQIPTQMAWPFQELPLATLGFDDELMERSIRNLAKLQSFYLNCDANDTSKVTYKSMISFAKHCPNLQRLNYPAHVDFEMLVLAAKGDGMSWSELRSFVVARVSKASQQDGWVMYQDVDETAKELVELMPKLYLAMGSEVYCQADRELNGAFRRLHDEQLGVL